MALSQSQMRVVGVVLTIALLGGGVAIVVHQMKKPAKVLVVETGQPAPPGEPTAIASPNGKPVSGVVINADGSAVSGVEVLLVPEGSIFYLDGPRAQNYPAVRTDAQGKFAFPQPNAWWDLVAMNENGLARLAPEELPADGKIMLRPWGRVEGIYLAGQSPQANQLLSVFQMPAGRAIATADPATPYRMVSPTGHVRINKKASTDAQGHFVFERIPSGP